MVEYDDEKIITALKSKDTDLIKSLITASNANVIRIYGFTPLMLAIIYNKPKTIIYLLDIGSDVNATSNESDESWDKFEKYGYVNIYGGDHPLDIALTRGLNIVIIDQLIKYGANVNARNRNGTYPLTLSVVKSTLGNIYATKLLVDNGADVNATDKNGETPLSIAVYSSSMDNIEYLISKGARITYNVCKLASKSNSTFVKDYLRVKCRLLYAAENRVINKFEGKGNIPNNILDFLGGFGEKKSISKKIPSKKERIVKITKSKVKGKKYTAIVKNTITKKTRTINFGAKGYQQYRDSTKLKAYKSKNHSDPKRRRSYFSRHSGVPTKQLAVKKEWKKSKGLYNPKILSHMYLW
jgi:ankyrin repeat protein